MSEINIHDSNKLIIDKYFNNLTCDEYTESIFKGGQSQADERLANIDIKGYSKRRNNVYPATTRGSSFLSPYIRHGLLNLCEVWKEVDSFQFEDRAKFRDELLWQEFSRHLYAIMGQNNKKMWNYSVENTNKPVNTSEMNCIQTIKNELVETGYMVNQTRMWFSSHHSFRAEENWNKYEDFMFKHLVDGSRFANRLGWQWVMGGQTGKLYGFAQSQVKNRAPKLCQQCNLQYKCPIQTWPDESKYEPIDREIDYDIKSKFGPTETINSHEKPSVVWLTGESMGDDDPALKAHPELPVIFIFDNVLLNKIQISTKRIIFLLETLKELALKRKVLVFIGDPKLILNDYNYAVTFACVPKYKEITMINKPVAEYPTVRLADPISFYPQSYTSWKKKITLTV
ncbi:hypothetical protein N9X26_00285 [Candidatus Actinomarina sp.]|nr:hypothetical protein [Candidatus Actinomarina sp.]